MEELQDHPAEEEVDFSGDEESLELLEEGYDVGKKFAEGGQGELFHGFDRRLNRLVALKSLRGEPFPEISGCGGSSSPKRGSPPSSTIRRSCRSTR